MRNLNVLPRIIIKKKTKTNAVERSFGSEDVYHPCDKLVCEIVGVIIPTLSKRPYLNIRTP